MTDAHLPSHGEAGGGHSRFQAHHFESAQQQYDSGKLGMWIFLLTEILFFGGLFCAYAVYRANHPDIFIDGHHFLNTTLGAANTAVLIFSSLTMAWGVRSAQLGQTRGLVFCLVITLVCAFTFLGIKYVEYSEKMHHGLIPSQFFFAQGTPRLKFEPNEEFLRAQLAQYTDPDAVGESLDLRVKKVRTFFAIYFCMTGLHALHVIAGIIAIFWILVRSLKGHFSSAYFGPVDYVGLYWHLVDLIWIYLFPLLYLIH
jgi:cytochrome c oxidase subunit 3